MSGAVGGYEDERATDLSVDGSAGVRGGSAGG